MENGAPTSKISLVWILHQETFGDVHLRRAQGGTNRE